VIRWCKVKVSRILAFGVIASALALAVVA